MFPSIPETVLAFINSANSSISNVRDASELTPGATGSEPVADVDKVKSESFSLTASVKEIISTFEGSLNSAAIKPLLESIEKLANGLSSTMTKSQIDTRISMINNRASQIQEYVSDAAGNFELSKMFNEADSLGISLGGFSTNIADNISDPDLSPNTPSFSDVVDDIKIDALVERAKVSKDGLPGFAVGSINDCIYKASSTIREYGMASSPKSLMYLTAGQELYQVQDNLNSNMGKVVNYLRGTAPGQNDIA